MGLADNYTVISVRIRVSAINRTPLHDSLSVLAHCPCCFVYPWIFKKVDLVISSTNRGTPVYCMQLQLCLFLTNFILNIWALIYDLGHKKSLLDHIFTISIT